MDLKQFDNRTRAETGFDLVLCDPETRLPLADPDGGEPPIAVLRGVASKTAQRRMADMRRKYGKNIGKVETVEDVHQNLIHEALPYVAGFKNVTIEGEDATASEEHIRKVLDLTFPQMRIVRDVNNDPVKDEAGKPVVEMANWPFSMQIIEAASEYENFSGGSKKG